MPAFKLLVADWAYTTSKVLKNTEGGYPHVTLFFVNDNSEEVKEILIGLTAVYSNEFQSASYQKLSLSPENVKLNVFTKETTGQQRFDVLMHLDEHDIQFIESCRKNLIESLIYRLWETFSDLDPLVEEYPDGAELFATFEKQVMPLMKDSMYAETIKDISMEPPHITHSTHDNEADALAALEKVKKHLPHEVYILTAYV